VDTLSSPIYEGRIPKQTNQNRLSSLMYEGRVHKQTSQNKLSSPMYEGSDKVYQFLARFDLI
jgi:hypothetical protein